MNYLQLYLILSLANMFAVLGLGVFAPEYRDFLVNEDSLIENLSVIIFICTFIFGFLFSVKNKKNRKALIVVSAIGLIGFLDEISFGERLLSLNMPYIGGVKIDSAHDFFYLGYKIAKKYTYAYATYIYPILGAGAVTMTLVAINYRYKLIGKNSNVELNQVFIFASIFIGLIFAALIVDLNIMRNKTLFALEEVLELNAAMALMFCCFTLYRPRLYQKKNPKG